MTAFIDCGCNGNCYPSNSCGGTNCKCKPAKEVCYSGPPLSCLGINPKDTIDVALQKINTFLCGQQFIDLVNNAIECQTIINCLPTTTTTSTTLNPALCKDQGLQALSIDGGSWVATDCLGEAVGGLVPGDGGTYYTGCVNVTTLVLTNAEIKETIDC